MEAPAVERGCLGPKCECGCGVSGGERYGSRRRAPGVVVPRLPWEAEFPRRLTQPQAAGLCLQGSEGLGGARGSECLTSSQVMLTLAQGPHCENDSKVTENLAPWSLEEMTGS